MKKVKPIEDKVLVKIIEEPQTTASGIVLPDTAEKDKPTMGEVMAVGDSEMIKVKVGDKVLFAKFSGTEVKINGEDHLILPSADILAVVEL